MYWQEKYQEWLTSPVLPEKLCQELVNITDQKELEDRFYQYLEFGTGGMRGELGVGINRLNEVSIRRVASGLASYIVNCGEMARKKGVVIAYDNRHFSKEFARLTAQVLASHDIKVFLSDCLRPTPELSFLVRDFQAFMGVMITASHNPANYNGFKVYNQTGGQITLKMAQELANYLGDITSELEITTEVLAYYVERGLVSFFGREADDRYLEKLRGVFQNPTFLREKGSNYPIVYTPVHGAGLALVTRGLIENGLTDVQIVQEQADDDSDFSTVMSPNPEDPAVFELAMRLGREKRAELLLATDPDADRLGVAVKLNSADYCLLTGNQIGVLLLTYLLETKATKGEALTDFFVVKTIVTSELGSQIAQGYGVETRNTLTGFKFIGEQIELAHAKKDKKFLFGYEESFGYLIDPFVRDKDGIQAAVLLAEAAVYYRERGKTLLSVLENSYRKYGYYQEHLDVITFKGKAAQAEMVAKIEAIRNGNCRDFGHKQVSYIEDYLRGIVVSLETQLEKELTLPKSNVLKFVFEDDSWFCIRPSGTEPKCKIYFSVHEETLEQAQKTLDRMRQDVMRLF